MHVDIHCSNFTSHAWRSRTGKKSLSGQFNFPYGELPVGEHGNRALHLYIELYTYLDLYSFY